MHRMKGFTLVELMITLGIIALLAVLAYPSFTQWVRKANRGDAQALLINWANNQEIWRATNTQYGAAAQVPKPTHPRYNFPDAVVGANTFTLTAEATTVGRQDQDAERGTDCSTLTINQAGVKTPPICWQE